jgi:hypothetical protein
MPDHVRDGLTAPHSIDAEQSVLGAVLLRNEALADVAGLRAEDFYREAHRRIFAQMLTLHERGVAIDLVTLREALTRAGDLDEVGGAAYISKLVDGVPRSTNAAHYAEIVSRKARQRLMFAKAQELAAAAARDDDPTITRLTHVLMAAQADANVAGEIADTLPAFLERELAVPKPIAVVFGLVLSEAITLIHGQPRGLKTWILLVIALAVASGREVFGNLRTQQGPVLYITNEDSPRQTADRLDALCRGYQFSTLPRDLHLMVRKGISLDDPASQDRMMRYAEREGITLTIAEPLRSLSDCVDQGPRELRPLATFLRHYQQMTGSALMLGHHDTKPLPGLKDDRSRPQRASGGGLFSIADSPIHCERIVESPATALLVPTAWKFGETPSPLEVTLTWDDDGARLTAKETSGESAAAREMHGRIRDFLLQRGEASGREVATGVRASRQGVAEALETMFRDGKIDSRPGPKRSTLWFLKEGEIAS